MAEKPSAPVKTGCDAYTELIHQYGWEKNIAIAVMKAESGCNTHAVGDNYPIGGLLAPSCGLFQVRTLAGRPTCEELKDPATNVAWAYRLYTARGFQPWSVYNSGAYQKYM